MRLRRFSLPAAAVAVITAMGVGTSSAGAASCPRMNAGQTPAQRTSELLGARSFAHWDTASHEWVVSAGTYQVMVGSSSRDIVGQGTVTLPTTSLGQP